MTRNYHSTQEKNMQIVEHQNQRILTTQQLAEAYETDEKRISENFNRNKDRYTAEKHYYSLEGEIKRQFLMDHPQFADGLKNASVIYLWTKRGAFMHAKSLNTDKAWEVYEGLVDFYFDKREKQTAQPPQELPLQGYDDLMAIITHKESRKQLMKALQKIDRGYQDVEGMLHTETLALSEAKEQPDLRTELLAYLATLEEKHVTASYIRQYGPGSLRNTSAGELTKELNALASAGMLQKEILPGKTAPRFFLPVRVSQ
jgi:hypothetical protein